MLKLWSVAIVALAAVLVSPGLARAQGEQQVFVLFVDDLHLEFRSTPRLRELVRRLLPVLARDDAFVGVVTTGYSSIAIKPTRDQDVLLSGIRSITGGGLRPDEIVGLSGTGEVLYRATIAITTARDTIEALAERKAVLLYLSDGYGERRVAALEELISAAKRASTTVHTFELRALFIGSHATPSPSNEAAWNAYYRDARDSLQQLAYGTGGQMVTTPAEFDALMAGITSGAQ